jgi:hypothetical protein
VRAMLAMISRAQVKRARFAFTMSPSIRRASHSRLGNRAVSYEIPGFASPPRDGFALDDPLSGGAIASRWRT